MRIWVIEYRKRGVESEDGWKLHGIRSTEKAASNWADSHNNPPWTYEYRAVPYIREERNG